MIFTGGRQPLVQCVQCKRISDRYWLRWRACRIDLPDSDDEAEIALFCPDCANREFGPPRRRPLVERRRAPR